MKKLLLFLSLALLISCGRKDGSRIIKQGIEKYKKEEYRAALNDFQEAANQKKYNIWPFTQAEVYTLMGNCLYELDQVDSAITHHKISLDIDSTNAEVWTNLGMCYRYQNEFEEARKCYDKALTIDRDYPEALSSMGVLLIKQENYKEARVYLERATSGNPDNPVLYSNFAVCLAWLGEKQLAEINYEKALELGYKHPEDLRASMDEGYSNFGIRDSVN